MHGVLLLNEIHYINIWYGFYPFNSNSEIIGLRIDEDTQLVKTSHRNKCIHFKLHLSVIYVMSTLGFKHAFREGRKDIF